MATQYNSVATDETNDLISSDKVEGTGVYDRQGEKLGSIHSLMIDKLSGRVAYAVMSFGGVLGTAPDGERSRPRRVRRGSLFVQRRAGILAKRVVGSQGAP